MNHKKHGLLLLAAISIFYFPVAAQETNRFAPVNSFKKEVAIERLKKNVPELMKAANVPGLSMALIRDGKLVWNQGFGVKNRQTSGTARAKLIRSKATSK
ncbi:MAG TPA: hypothetical protein VGB00_02670, partial [Pyrinomonadaceae bacterium]